MKQFKYFSIFQYEQEQEYLREKHRRGWRMTKITGLGMYHFEPCEGEDWIYQLDYNPEGKKNKAEYVQMFRDCGWEYMQDFVGYSYFRKRASEAGADKGIFCDEESRLQLMERVFKGRMLPLLAIFCAVLLPQFALNSAVYHNYFISVLMGGVLALYIAVFVGFAVKYSRFKKGL